LPIIGNRIDGAGRESGRHSRFVAYFAEADRGRGTPIIAAIGNRKTKVLETGVWTLQPRASPCRGNYCRTPPFTPFLMCLAVPAGCFHVSFCAV